MKKLIIILPFASLLLITVMSFAFNRQNEPTTPVARDKNGFAVVELFTSEGCSSCPAADAVLAGLAKDYPANVYVLGYHVDYWNYLGWKDAFSSADYSARQQAYGSSLNLSSIYTPQVIVNGTTEFTGSDKKRLYASVATALNTAGTALMLDAAADGSGNIIVHCSTKADKENILHLALVQLQAASTVTRGENKGRLLQHVNVVRDFKTIASGNAETSMHLPAGLLPANCKLVAFVQNSKTMQITSAGECPVK